LLRHEVDSSMRSNKTQTQTQNWKTAEGEGRQQRVRKRELAGHQYTCTRAPQYELQKKLQKVQSQSASFNGWTIRAKTLGLPM